MSGAWVDACGRSVSEGVPEVLLHAMDRRSLPGADTAHVYLRSTNPVSGEYGALSRGVSFSEVPPTATVNISHGVFHTLVEFTIHPRTWLVYLGAVLHSDRQRGMGLMRTNHNPLEPGTLAYVQYGFPRFQGCDFVRCTPFRSLDGPSHIAVVAVSPMWRADAVVDAFFRDLWDWRDLYLSGAMSWNGYVGVGLEDTGISAIGVSGVMAWKEDARVSAALNRDWAMVTGDLLRINEVVVLTRALGGGVTTLDVYNAPRWLQEAVARAAPNQWTTSEVRLRVNEVCSVDVEVVMEVTSV